MGESASARTDRELADLRAALDTDIRLLRERIGEDADPRRLARRNPLAVFGTLASIIAIGGVTTMRGLSARSQRRSDKDLDALISRLGGRIDQLRGRARKRFREQLRKEIGEVEQPPKPKRMFYDAAAAAITSALTLVAQRFASRLVGDEDLPTETIDTTARPSRGQLRGSS
jgi:hypothetical protein